MPRRSGEVARVPPHPATDHVLSSLARLPRIALALLVALGAVATRAPSADAQPLRPGLLVGRVTDEAGEGVAGAVLRATRGPRTVLAFSNDKGDFRLGGLEAGPWTIAIRRLGYRPLVVDVEMPPEGNRRTFTLTAAATSLDPVLVAERWTGVRGLVGDARRVSPLAGALVRVLGSDVSVGSDSVGQFAVSLPGGRDVLLRVERAGYATRLISASVPVEGYLQLEVALDTNPQAPRDYWVWRDLDQRLKFATPRAVLVGRDEIEATDAVNLGVALPATRSVTAANVLIDRRACLYVNGQPRPGFPVDAIQAGDVEFVEAYPPGSDLTRTLAQRWPAGAQCGVPDGPRRSSASASRLSAQFVSVWLRAP